MDFSEFSLNLGSFRILVFLLFVSFINNVTLLSYETTVGTNSDSREFLDEEDPSTDEEQSEDQNNDGSFFLPNIPYNPSLPVFPNFPASASRPRDMNFLLNLPVNPPFSNVPEYSDEYEDLEDFYDYPDPETREEPEEAKSFQEPMKLEISSGKFIDGQLDENQFPENSGNVKYLKIRNPNPTERGNLKSIKDYAFQKLQNLLELEIINQSLQEIVESSLENNFKLKKLNFEDNKIKELPGKLLRFNLELIEINLSRNQIQKIPEFFFKNLRKLRYLNLSENQLEKIPKDMLYGTSLTSLDFSKNLITRIEPGSLHINSGFINLSFNQLEILETNWFAGDSYSSISLSHNRIQEIPEDFFRTIHIEMIDLSFNKIEEIDAVFENVNWIYLENNRLRSFSAEALRSLKCSWSVVDLRANTCFNTVLDHEKLFEKFGRIVVELKFKRCNTSIIMQVFDLSDVGYTTYEDVDQKNCKRNEALFFLNKRRYDELPEPPVLPKLSGLNLIQNFTTSGNQESSLVGDESQTNGTTSSASRNLRTSSIIFCISLAFLLKFI